jgi:hypothetical protein
MANLSPIAGLNPPGSTGTSPNVFQNTLTPGYTGGLGSQSVIPGFDWSKVDPNTIAPYALFTGFAQDQRREERAAERELFNEVQAMRKREAQEAYQMQLPFKIGDMVGNIFQNIVQAQQPGLQTELGIRSRTADLLNQAYANPIANRKWFS